MKFSLFYEMQGAADRSDAALYEEHLGQFELAESLGYDRLWLAELHFNRDFSVMPAPQMVLAAASQRTERIRLGIGISVLPIHQPLRLAEEIATLDVLSGGRVDWGVGRGHPMTGIYEHFEVPIEESRARFEECFEIVMKAWTGEPFSHHGRFHQLEDVTVVPAPLQRPRPPVFVAAFSPDSAEFAASHGCHLYLPAQVFELDALARFVADYRERLAAHGHDPAQFVVPILLPVVVDTDRARARRIAEGPIMSYYAAIGRMMQGWMQGLERRHGRFPDSYRGYLGLGEALRGLDMDRICSTFGAVGDPAEVIDRLTEIREATGNDEFITWPNIGAMADEDVRRSMTLFAEQVRPALG